MTQRHVTLFLSASLLLAVLTGCKKDFENPNAATKEETFASDRAATAVADGMQRV